MRRIIIIISLLLVSAPVFAGTYRRVSPEKDSISVAAIRAYLDGIRAKRPTVALVLSGGGAKGAAEVGALKVLDSLAIPVDIVLGTSIGGLIGGMYATGYSQAEMESLIRSLDWQYLMKDILPRRYKAFDRKDGESFTLPFYYSRRVEPDSLTRSKRVSRSLPDGMVKGRNVSALISSLTVGYQDSTSFLSLPVPFVSVATELKSGKAKIWYDGHLNAAMRSTMSIPGVFEPVRYKGMVLIDGGQLNNYPVDLARECGADIVIGIDLSGGSQGLDNVLNVIMYSISVSAGETFEKNLAMTDVSIHPDLKGYDMMSFDTRSIDLMIDRGYKAAKAMEDTLKGILKRTGPADKSVPNKQEAVNLNLRKVRISEVGIKGVTPEEEKYLLKKIAKYTALLGRQELDACVSILSGTGAFERVSAEILGREEPYQLRFNCRKGPVNAVGVSIRADEEEYVAAQLRLGLNVGSLSGHSLQAKAKVGANSNIDLLYRYKTLSGLAFGAGAYYGYISRADYRFDAAPMHIARAEAFLSTAGTRIMNLRAGARLEYFRAKEYDFSKAYVSAFADLGIDSFDDAYFPSSGAKVNASYTFTPIGLNGSIDKFHTASLKASVALSPARWCTIVPSVAGRAVSGGAAPLPYTNLAGGYIEGRYLPQQLSFVGIRGVRQFDRTVVTGRLDARLEIFRNNYISAIYNCLADAQDVKGLLKGKGSRLSHGAALEYGLRTIAGPVRAGLCWSDLTHRLGLYISVGYNF